MRQYIDLCNRILRFGSRKSNRTGIDTFGLQGAMMQFDLQDGFPAVTTKKLAYRSCFAEMLGFLRGHDSARDFRLLGTPVWDANANENTTWLANPNRRGEDDLGRIYGVQARRWQMCVPGKVRHTAHQIAEVDQLRNAINKIKDGIDDRRLIVTHWNPGELDQMSLPPCHLLYQFGIDNGYLNMCMYQRSCDMPLGVPFNIAGYAWLLSVVAHITGLKPGKFTHFLWDVHIYVNQIPNLKIQLARDPKDLPILVINPEIRTLNDLESKATVDDFELLHYYHHDAIKFPFAV